MILERLLSLLKGYYEEFVEALGDYVEGRERVYAVERLAQLVAQTVLDIAAVLASRERGAKPGTYRGLAIYLAEKLGLRGEEREFLIGLAGFRNILVHMYADIDPQLEMEAFMEIKAMMPTLIRRLERLAAGDPCIWEVAPKLRLLAERLGLRAVLVFGSLARRGCGRDVDVAVLLGRRPRSMLEVGRLQALMEDELGAPVDLVVIEALSDPALAREILEAHTPVHGDADEARLRLYKLLLDQRPAARLTRSRPAARGATGAGD